jgi:hypothetical protein
MHCFLGFESYLGPRKRPSENSLPEDDEEGRKRRRQAYITVEMRDT